MNLLSRELARHRSEDTCSDRLIQFIDEHGGVGIGTVCNCYAWNFFTHTDNHEADASLDGESGAASLHRRRRPTRGEGPRRRREAELPEVAGRRDCRLLQDRSHSNHDVSPLKLSAFSS